jgi:hypothetical protein
MVPRAEIAIIIFSAIVVVSLVTTIIIPVVLRFLLQRWPPIKGKPKLILFVLPPMFFSLPGLFSIRDGYVAGKSRAD